MTTTIASAALMPVAPVFTNTERLALAGFLAGYTGLTVRRTAWTCASSSAGATSTTCACSVSAVPASSASAAIWKRVVVPAPR